MNNQPKMSPLGLIDRAALEHLQSKALRVGFSHWDVWREQHTYAFTVAKMMDEDLLAEVQAALVDALKNGTSFDTFKLRLKPFLMSRGWWGEAVMIDPMDDEPKWVQLGSYRRLRTIFETNMATAHAAGQWQRIQKNKKSLPYLRYNPSHSLHQRDAHKRYYGLILPVEHPIWQQIFPPNGYGCRCSVTQLTRGQAQRAGISPEPDFEFVDVENPRTGEVVRVPRDIDPSFAHNHVRRERAVLDVAQQRHGADFAAKLSASAKAYANERVRLPHPMMERFTGRVSFAGTTSDSYTLGKHTFTKEDLIGLSGAVDGTELNIMHYPEPNNPFSEYPALVIFGKNVDVYQYNLQRMITLTEDGVAYLENQLQELLPEQRGQGLAVFALLQQIQAARELNIPFIHAYAAGSLSDKTFNGYYTWARLGFNNDRGKDVFDIWGRPSHPDFKHAKDVADLMQTEEGRQWWKEHGWALNLYFDLSDNSKSFKILLEYLKKRFDLE